MYSLNEILMMSREELEKNEDRIEAEVLEKIRELDAEIAKSQARLEEMQMQQSIMDKKIEDMRQEGESIGRILDAVAQIGLPSGVYVQVSETTQTKELCQEKPLVCVTGGKK